MANAKPSIFNDVLGPIMRGPSSSHSGGAYRIAALIRNAHGIGNIEHVLCEFDTEGTQAATHIGHGSDLGFLCGMLGIELKDERVPKIFEIAAKSEPKIVFDVVGLYHPDPTLHRVTITQKNGEKHVWDGSTSMGGGMIEMLSYDGYAMSLNGDYYELLLIVSAAEADAIRDKLAAALEPDAISVCLPAEHCTVPMDSAKLMINAKFHTPIAIDAIDALGIAYSDFKIMEPVLPTKSQAKTVLPFVTAEETAAYLKEHPMSFADAGCYFEAVRGGTSMEEAREKMKEILSIMRGGVEGGLAGTEYADRILGPQSHMIAQAEAKRRLVPDPIINRIIESVSAVMETKSSYGAFVASPTGGSCGCLPGTLIGVAKALELSDDQLVDALFAAGLIGVYISYFSCFGSDVGSCQAECGSAGAMAAAGIVTMMGGTPDECMTAASLALHGVTGLGCDPIGGRVEVPCLEKNILCGVNALACANMALAGFDPVVPLDESVQAIAQISTILPQEIRCSLECGLSIGCTSRMWEQRLAEMAK